MPAWTGSPSASTRSTTRRSCHERRRLPGLARPRWDRGGGGGRTRTDQGQRGDPPRAQRARHRATWPSTSAAPAYDGSLHRVHGRRAHQRMAPRRRGARRRDGGRDRRALAARAGRLRLSGRGRAALSVPRRRRRDRRHQQRHAAVLRRLHPGPPVGRRAALHLPLRHVRPRPARRSCVGRQPKTSWRRRSASSGPAATTATPSCARSRRSSCPRWR